LPRQAPHQQILRSQQSKKTIAPQFHTRLLQGRLQDVPQLARPQARLTKPLCSHQPQDQLRIHLLPLALATPRIIILPAHSHLLTQPTHGDSPQRAILPYGLMSGWPSAFFLNSSTSAIPARWQARRVYARSKAKSKLLSASAPSKRRTRFFNRANSLISPGFSTRTTFTLVLLPYLPVQVANVASFLIR